MNPATRNHTHPVHILLITTIALALAVMPASAAFPITVTDDAGSIVVLNATPSRIVSLSPSNTEILAALSLTDRMAGVTDYCDYPPAVKNITRIGGYSSISIEKVAAARPDLVFASDITQQETVDRLRELGLTVVVLAPRNIEHMIRDIRMAGTLTGTESRAEDLAHNLSTRMAALAPCPSAKGRPSVAHIVWHEPLYVSGNDTLQNDVIIRTGGKNAFTSFSGWGTVSLEEFLMKNPDIIIVNGGGGMDSSERDIILEEFTNNPQYASLSAVKTSRIYAVDADIISRPAPRVVDAAEQVAAMVHPECFTQNASASSAGATTGTPAQSPGFSAALSVLLLALVIVMVPPVKR